VISIIRSDVRAKTRGAPVIRDHLPPCRMH
jgi:hypothetical protein